MERKAKRKKRLAVYSYTLIVAIVFSLILGQGNLSSFFSQASNDTVESEFITATVTLDGKAPEQGKFKFELLDENGKRLDVQWNDSKGSFKFEKAPLEKANKTYTIRQIEVKDDNIEYGELEKKVNVEVKEVEEAGEVGKFDDAIGFVGNGDGRTGRIKVTY